MDGGFPETKELKRRVRDVIEPGRDLGHVDRHHAKPATATAAVMDKEATTQDKEEKNGVKGEKECEDCK